MRVELRPPGCLTPRSGQWVLASGCIVVFSVRRRLARQLIAVIGGMGQSPPLKALR